MFCQTGHREHFKGHCDSPHITCCMVAYLVLPLDYEFFKGRYVLLLRFAYYFAHSKQPINMCGLHLYVEMYYLVGKKCYIAIQLFKKCLWDKKIAHNFMLEKF